VIRDPQIHLADLSRHRLVVGAIARVAGPAGRRLAALVAEMLGHLDLEPGLENGAHQIRQKTASPVSATPSSRARDELLSPLAHRPRRVNPQTTNAYDPYGQIAPPGGVATVAGSGERSFDVTVYRIVTQYGIQIRQDSFFSRYVPVANTRVYGPGTHPPRPYIVIPNTT
jgi:hypothetical protein